jgi:hypothetical protein
MLLDVAQAEVVEFVVALSQAFYFGFFFEKRLEKLYFVGQR